MAATIDEARATKNVKTLFGWLLFRRISLPLSLRVARTRIRPSHITAFGLLVGLGGAALIGTGSRTLIIAGALLANAAKILDAMDGEVARAKFLDTPTGYVLDGLADRLRDTAVIVGCGVGAFKMAGASSTATTHALVWTIGAVVGYLGFFYVSGAAPSHWREVRTQTDLEEKHMFRVSARIRLGAGDSLAVLVLAAALAGHPLIVDIVVAAVGPLAIALKIRKLLALRPWDRASSETTDH